jgi:hypothetical protein
MARGNQARGEQHHFAKLEEGHVVELLELWHHGARTIRQLAIKFGISESHVYAITSGRSWSHLSAAPPRAAAETPDAPPAVTPRRRRAWQRVTESDARVIHSLHRCGISAAEIARNVDVTPDYVTAVLAGTRWPTVHADLAHLRKAAHV